MAHALTPAADERLPLPTLQGERCLLRALVPSDAARLRVHADNVNVWRNLFEGFPSPYLQSHADAWCGHEANSGDFGYVWGIVVDGAVAGCIGLAPHVRPPGSLCNAEIGYWLGESCWRRGIASDAVRQVVDWGFASHPRLTRIFAPIYARNVGSQAVARRCGFTFEGLLKMSVIKAGEVIDGTLWRPIVRPASRARPPSTAPSPRRRPTRWSAPEGRARRAESPFAANRHPPFRKLTP